MFYGICYVVKNHFGPSFSKSGQTIVYSYDDKGERILKKTASVNEYYLRDHTGRELAIYDLSANRIKMANIYGNGLIGRVDVNWIQTTGFYWDENHMKVFYTTTTRSDDRCYYIKDHLGSNRMTINSLGVVTNVQDYYAYGEVLRSYNNSTPNEKYKFTGKERDTETDLDYFGARYYDSELGRWLSVDPFAYTRPGLNPYNYCQNSPLIRIDPNGKWDIKVSVAKDRSANGYGVAKLYDRNGYELYSWKVRAEGAGGHNRSKKNNDTPLGTYDIPDKNMWKSGGDRGAYGPNPRLVLNPQSGEIVETGRNEIRMHGGRQELYNKETGEWTEIADPQLKKTNGCLRATDEDMEKVKEITDGLMTSDKKEKGGSLEVSDDLQDTPPAK